MCVSQCTDGENTTVISNELLQKIGLSAVQAIIYCRSLDNNKFDNDD